jgi:hypothetical protein
VARRVVENCILKIVLVDMDAFILSRGRESLKAKDPGGSRKVGGHTSRVYFAYPNSLKEPNPKPTNFVATAIVVFGATYAFTISVVILKVFNVGPC